jgi:hypothetical protein
LVLTRASMHANRELRAIANDLVEETQRGPTTDRGA